MTSPHPHGFSRSPVENVACSWISSLSPAPMVENVSPGTLIPGASGRFTLLFGSPYPGWQVISGRLAMVLGCVTDARGTISRCRLSFSDRFILSPGDDIPSLFFLSRFFSAIVKPGMSTQPRTCTIPSSLCTDTMVKISFFCGNKKERFVDIEFHLCSVSDTNIGAEEALSWFEAAHSEIHLLFDEIVSEEIRLRLL